MHMGPPRTEDLLVEAGAGLPRRGPPVVLSVVIPSYNGAQWLPRSVAAAFTFSELATEVLVVDDGSTDETPRVLEKLGREHPALRVLTKANGGLSSARNHGIAHATGQYIVLLDADDELLPCDLAGAVARGVDAIRIGVEEVRMDESRRVHVENFEPCSGEAYLQERFAAQRFHTPSWAWLYRRSFLLDAGLTFTPDLIHEDMLFTVEALLAARSILAVPHLAYRYFKREGSITTTVDEHKLYKRVRSLSYIARQLTAYANANSSVDVGWWALQAMDYARLLSVDAPSLRIRLCLFTTECRFFWSYNVWGQYRTFRNTRFRLPLAFGYLAKGTRW